MKYSILMMIMAIAISAVVPLTSENFDEIVDGTKNVFIKFYAPWCGHCQSLAPEYVIVGDSFSSTEDVVIAEVNADEEKKLGERFAVHGYPTLKFFAKGEVVEPMDYKEERSADAIIQFINTQAGTNVKARIPVSPVKTLTPSNFDEIVKNSGKVVFIKFYAPWCGHCKHLAPIYKDLAIAFAEESNIVIAEVDCDAHRQLAQPYGVTGFPTLKIFVNGEPSDYSGDRTIDDMVEFVNDAAGTARKADGSVDNSYGRIAVVDAVLAEIEELTEESIAKVKEVLTTIGSELNANKKIYEGLLKKIAEKGPEYITTEKARIKKFLMSESVSKLKKGAFRIRSNVLDAFNNLKKIVVEEEL